MPNKVSVKLERTSRFQLRGTTPQGQVAVIDAPVSIGGRDEGVRPMEMLLMSLAGCASVDVLMILEKQRQEVEDCIIEVEGTRADSVPAVYESIRLHFKIKGQVLQSKLDEALKLSAEKYCSVSTMLSRGGVNIQWSSEVVAN